MVELVHELTDEDVGDEADEDEEDDIKDAPLKTLIDGLVTLVQYFLQFIFERIIWLSKHIQYWSSSWTTFRG